MLEGQVSLFAGHLTLSRAFPWAGPFCRTLAPGHPGDVPEFGLPGLAPSLLLVTRQGVAVPLPGRGPLNFTVF